MAFHLVDGVRASGVEMIYGMDFVRYVIQEIHVFMILIRILLIALPILTTLHTPHTKLTRNRPAFYNNRKDDDEDYTIAITPDFSITNSLIMEDEHLDTILENESDEYIKSSVENLVPNPSESKDLSNIGKFNSKNSNAIIESFSPSPIPVEDSDPFVEEIDLFLASDGSIPLGIDSDYSDSERDNLFLERLLHDDPIPLSDTLDFSNVV
uniref:Uncharacterized protein n=1 Tax=Tanacetum cinerariifolium TaxID=118510 RepID=A0A699IY82_TANCI|nr:hypothetical protein [Tanacetum cinerariifolium]